MKQPISITAIASVSPLGQEPGEIWARYLEDKALLAFESYGKEKAWVAPLTPGARKAVDQLRGESAFYRSLDDSVLYALLAGRSAAERAGWKKGNDFGINVGSSRGATSLFEKYHAEFLQDGQSSTQASPATTLGNISSWLAHDLQSQGPDISHSITCSTALHALLNGVAWLEAGMADKFLVGGSEASLTPFTLAQMRALKIYSTLGEAEPYPCRALDLDKKMNTMILGEAAAMACLEKGVRPNALALVSGIGYATEPLQHSVSLSTDAQCFQRSMKMAVSGIDPSQVDAIVMHAPGTRKGDMAEHSAISAVFGEHKPALTSNKWKVGHTFGASGMLSVELAVLMLQHQHWIPVPFLQEKTGPGKLERILVNAVGFGGNAVSILLQRPGTP
ncbi:beta-ketoacyl synthase N-terminal-like domain-containing protein [Zeaxanthinibacter sp. PT1]|uniref:beta-ketoacyl synthase N-terminal-like domain-containing protein n=1 Tax=Zeaxanthinibacter TaxID=561554 RepID=UPI00234BB238|nr:beta-ketoacyl synthase N-terminal-like domain-containing protein [Zeaxanthinibacter sp. PT1]MDC6351065.1 beta-ketoacyl synthase N-terminal-like domain-containing protein [Zeaxanthinibacter sp. PT1]